MINTMPIENSTVQLWITLQFTNTGFIANKTVFISEIMASGSLTIDCFQET
jgi:hypothetical protein